jgi:hypothetical protein
MKDTRNITIIVLSVTALVLLAMLVGNLMQTSPAYADGAVRSGDYIMVNGSIGQGSDLIYVVNVPARRMVVYFPTRQGNNRTIEIVDSLDLDQLFKSN